jgi:hypothetical protein
MKALPNLLMGLLAGTLCALGGALKDVRYEGFKPLTFMRSIVVGVAWGAVSGLFTESLVFAFCFSGYLERATVEGWKIVRDLKPGKFFHGPTNLDQQGGVLAGPQRGGMAMKGAYLCVILCALCGGSSLRAQQVVQLQTSGYSFSVPVTSAKTVITLPVQSQWGHMVTFTFSNFNTGSCSVWLEGSSNGGNTYEVLAQAVGSNITANPSQFLYANGFYASMRLVLNPLAVSCGVSLETFSGTYYGIQDTVPINPQSTIWVNNSVGSAQILTAGWTYALVYEVTGITCFNPNASTAYLETFDTLTTPTLGTGMNFEAGIAAGATFTMTGPPYLGSDIFYIGAATTPTGSTAVSTALSCTVSLNISGPFYPFSFRTL